MTHLFPHLKGFGAKISSTNSFLSAQLLNSGWAVCFDYLWQKRGNILDKWPCDGRLVTPTNNLDLQISPICMSLGGSAVVSITSPTLNLHL